ncbi:thioredoxin fold domain-containing protein [Virgibacillus dakarensis]|uniref:Thioredoxin n=1 Tax=Lentibacillus populi TaxID=1827502 RepID=A0A9W5X703_9BACI|nr:MULTISPECIES: thioredoxin family protein [Bacillaceae]MBT2215343.1 thioredoxin family protein [Virgibacillus dakarensis]MTW85489.1 thioredoxin fold domain-containing protein [Virgibacillus dakarensis]GGB51712.1 thioredoxin [Lentibacillus populi]
MKKKMVIFAVVIVVLFAALYFVTVFKNKQAVDESDNPYGKENLKQETIDQLDDPLYQNQITPDKLDEKLTNEEDVFVYFYSPTCPHCKRVTPILVPMTEDFGVDMKKLNLWEFEHDWDRFGIEGTPTLVYYKDGKEVDRISGEGKNEEQTEEMYQKFLDKHTGK